MGKIQNTKNFRWAIDYIEHCRSAFPDAARLVLEKVKESILEKSCFGKNEMIKRLGYNNYILNGSYSL